MERPNLLEEPLEFVLKNVSRHVLETFCYEPNTNENRLMIKTLISNILNELVQTRIIYDVNVVCDSTNNTSETIDANEIKLQIQVKRTKTDEFNLINFIASCDDWIFPVNESS